MDSTKAAGLVIAAELRKLVDVDEYIAGHKEINEAVPVEISPRGTSAKATYANSGFVSNILELAIAKVPVEGIAAEAREVNVLPTIVVEVSYSDPHPPPFMG